MGNDGGHRVFSLYCPRVVPSAQFRFTVILALAVSLTRVTSVSLATNVLLFALKFWGFLMSGSVALFSDAMNSLLDVASSTAVLVSVRVGRKAPDREHPFGHSRAEPIAGFVLAVIACVLAVEVLQESIVKFLSKHDHEVSPWLFGILGVAIASKLVLAGWQQRVGRAAGSLRCWQCRWIPATMSSPRWPRLLALLARRWDSTKPMKSLG
ncbi:MAG: cation transporter [Chlorobi bacterium OLB7]|nr:MAG: cation transporter [Chlorobi bacterium OLB7]